MYQESTSLRETLLDRVPPDVLARGREAWLWLSEPPGLYVALAAVTLIVILTLRRRRSRSRPWDGDDARERLRRARGEGDFATAGEIYEELGKHRAALKAYRRSGSHRRRAELLERLGKRGQARLEAHEAQAWDVYAELCERDEDFAAAGESYLLLGRHYEAGRCFETAGENLRAARAFLEADIDEPVLRLLEGEEGPEAAGLFERALRASWSPQPSPAQVNQLRRCVQLLIEAGEAERAFKLAVDSEQWELAVPVARDHLEPSAETAAACVRAGAHLAAAELFERIGEEREAALQRAEHHERAGQRADAARWFERAEAWDLAAEHWAASGEPRRSAELFERLGDLRQAAVLYGLAGEPDEQRRLEERLEALAPSSPVEADRTSRQPTVDFSQADRFPDPVGRHPGERYELQEEVGRGGMGRVYRAFDHTLQRQVAVKVLLGQVAQRQDASQELLAEARAIAQLSHPHIVQVYDAGHLRGHFFLAMEWVDGQDLARLLEHKRLSVGGVIHLGRQICSALEHAHRRRIIHRDLKPSNLLLAEKKNIKLTDFGLARVLELSVNQVVTRPAGTPYYMAPEQISGKPLDARVDLYALGCVLFELLCRQAPFAGSTSSIYHHLNSPPRDPRDLCADAPEPLAALILRCLEKDPERRPASAAEVGRLLAACR